MFLFLLALCLAAVWKLRSTRFNPAYLGINQTTAVKGFFTGLIFLSHLNTYLDLSLRSTADGYAVKVLLRIGQLMVAYFFFCSGFGILTSYRSDPAYEKGFLKHRVLKLLIHFDIAVFLHLILSLLMKEQHAPLDYVLCWIGWKSLGRSNWFIFVMLALYMTARAAFALRKRTGMSEGAAVAAVYVLSAALWVFLYRTRQDYWYNTLLCFPLGMSVCLHKARIDEACRRNGQYIMLLAAAAVLWFIAYRVAGAVGYSVSAMLFCLLIMMLSMKLEVRSPVLNVLGRYAFEIYVLHRLPMTVLRYSGVTDHYVFGLVSLAVTAIAAFLFKRLERKIDARLGLQTSVRK